MNITPTFSFAATHHRVLREAWHELIAQQHWTFFVTLTWNRQVTRGAMREHMSELHKRVDERFLGRRFYKHPAARTQVLFCTEKVRTYPHVHSLWRVEGHRVLRFARMFSQEGLWNAIVPSGTVELGFARGMDAARYVTKEHHADIDADCMIWSADLISARR